MKKIKLFLLGIALVASMSSCKDWLQVDQYDKILEGDIYKNEGNIEEVLNGLYLQMGTANLYGFNLGRFHTEILAQTYNYPSTMEKDDPSRYFLSRYNWEQQTSKDAAKAMWKSLYNMILATNEFILNVENNSVVGETNRNIMVGEAYAIRAMLHFDLFRLFGPVYGTEGADTDKVMPYYESSSSLPSAFLTSGDIMDRILKDLDKAIGLLAKDPVIDQGRKIGINYEDDYYSYRNYRLNYYAVKALKARALMYWGMKSEAAILAQEILDSPAFESNTHFPWTTKATASTSDLEDRIFSSEVLFGIRIDKMYKQYTDRYSDEISLVSKLLALSSANSEELFTDDPTLNADVRARNVKNYSANAEYKRIVKFEKSPKETDAWYFFPMIRKSELYFILCEVNEDFTYLDKVKNMRTGKDDDVLPGPYDQDVVTLEFRREFLLEGQLFYYYKRLNTASIRYGDGSGMRSMTPQNYRLPWPKDDELE